MKIKKNISLKKYNTFGVDFILPEIFVLQQRKDVKALFKIKKLNKNSIFVLGGGSNILITKNILKKYVLKIEFDNIKILENGVEEVLVEVESGKNWHEFVSYCIENDFSGVENLSLIPGNTGGAVFGNIGAYGTEIKDVVEKVNVFNISKNKTEVIKKEDCLFDYRTSLFKKNKNKFIILSTVFRLKKNKFNVNLNYKELFERLKDIYKPTIKNTFEEVIKIRNSKLVNPEKFGNAGSFFKNPVVKKSFLKDIKHKEEISFYDLKNGEVKIPAAFLIEKCCLKGFKKGNVAVSEKHALILINLSYGDGEEILRFAELVKQKVFDSFGIWLEMEVEVI